MDKMKTDKRNKVLIKIIELAVIIGAFVLVNGYISKGFRQRVVLISDGTKCCYGIDSLEKEDDRLTLKGWFFELESIQGTPVNVKNKDGEFLLALIPTDEAKVGSRLDDMPLMKSESIHDYRPDVNRYFSCEYDYSNCGFVATIDCGDIDLLKTSYRIAVKTDAAKTPNAILTNVYLTENGVSYTDPSQSPMLDVVGTELEKVVTDGKRLVSRPDYNCYVYQYIDELYWIADEKFEFSADGYTLIQFQMETTQIDNLPRERIENDWLWSNISDSFEKYEITNQVNCGKYRVSVRKLPKEYSVTNIWTGFYDKELIWREDFKPYYDMLI